ncbi:MAG: hypothetical protein OEN01_07265 [Candidatus Krumholzibacteria bacterium]|nr:hypothetical protein [Candidatus Krumholzibacteria bacterium]
MKRISNSGINYLDIMLVISFLGAVIGVSLPLISDKGGGKGLERATEMISSSVLLTRQKALAGNTNYRIRYTYDEHSYQIYREEHPGSWKLDPPENRSLLPKDVMVSSSSTPANGILTIGTSGRIDAGHSRVLLRLSDREGNRLTIRISQDGRVQEVPNW